MVVAIDAVVVAVDVVDVILLLCTRYVVAVAVVPDIAVVVVDVIVVVAVVVVVVAFIRVQGAAGLVEYVPSSLQIVWLRAVIMEECFVFCPTFPDFLNRFYLLKL